ncbi:hypothetical protein L873DRAFT_1816966 [Choiromyces venosus 120613-1]|uniref:Uncharacterized protein n=1 Tax=Choiromyces venosus 120613-1 TaxID=1336337 RepID=A0A3N4J3V5_9PEZI|nr:hypothetical protein L873DRAFT_1816966 [Choiromyces venosus 120613-1]
MVYSRSIPPTSHIGRGALRQLSSGTWASEFLIYSWDFSSLVFVVVVFLAAERGAKPIL